MDCAFIDMMIWCLKQVEQHPFTVSFKYKYEPGRNILWVKLSSVWERWWRHQRDADLPGTPQAEIKYQVRDFLCTKRGPDKFMVQGTVHRFLGSSCYMFGIDLNVTHNMGLHTSPTLCDCFSEPVCYSPLPEEMIAESRSVHA